MAILAKGDRFYERRIADLERENKYLRQSSEFFADLAERLNDRLRKLERAPQPPPDRDGSQESRTHLPLEQSEGRFEH